MGRSPTYLLLVTRVLLSSYQLLASFVQLRIFLWEARVQMTFAVLGVL